MQFVSAVVDIVRDLLIFVGAMFALLVVLILIIANMRADSPLKRILSAMSYRVAATLLAGVVAIPIEPIPGLDAIYDIGVPILLIIYWISLFTRAGRIIARPASGSAGRIIEHDSQPQFRRKG